MGVIKPYYSLYQNLLYLVKKSTPGKYQIVNVVVELNHVTVRDDNLLSIADKFFEEFAGCTISFFIDFFSGYDQVELDKKSRDFIDFIFPLSLMQMITLSQDTTNSIP